MVWLLVLVVLGACEARTLRVPAEYATIQAALGSVSNGDTVLVSLGTYPEALRAPGRAFVLMGDVPADTADIPRPVIDPSPLPHSDTLTCLIIPFGASIEVRNMRLRNGSEMFPRATPYPGGIRCLAATLRAEYCVFDSTAGGIATSRDSSARVELNGCRFVRNSRACVVMPGDPTVRPLRAALCRFEATGVENVVSAGGGSSLSYCDFQVEAASDMLSLAGRDCVVDHCTFRVSESVTNVIKLLGGPDGGCSGSIAYNTFDGINMWTAGIFAESACVDPVDIRYNVFRNNTRSTLTFAGQVYVRCHNNSPGTAAGIIEGNSFDACPGPGDYYAEGIGLYAGATVRRCDFHAMSYDSIPAVFGYSPPVTLSQNNFLNTRTALCKGWVGGDSLDARSNWWDDASGPRDSLLNPDGRGAAIACNHEVRISPWLQSPYSAAEPSPFTSGVPGRLSLSAYPNPFNPVTRLEYVLNAPGQVSLRVFDLLGREVALLMNDQQNAGTHSVEWSARADASGVYFAVLNAANQRTTQKLLLLR